jgi:hypothetical protein
MGNYHDDSKTAELVAKHKLSFSERELNCYVAVFSLPFSRWEIVDDDLFPTILEAANHHGSTVEPFRNFRETNYLTKVKDLSPALKNLLLCLLSDMPWSEFISEDGQEAVVAYKVSKIDMSDLKITLLKTKTLLQFS